MPNYNATEKKNRFVRPLILLIAICVLLVLIAYFLGMLSGKSGTISGKKLRCVVSQSVTPFDDRILYYDNSTLFCLSTSGSELWNAAVGEGAQFYAGDRRVAVWAGNQIMVFDRNGRSSYSDRLSDPVQFARVCSKYVAIVTGDSTSPTLTIRDMDGVQVDQEVNNYTDLMMLDCGFFGDGEFVDNGAGRIRRGTRNHHARLPRGTDEYRCHFAWRAAHIQRDLLRRVSERYQYPPAAPV